MKHKLLRKCALLSLALLLWIALSYCLLIIIALSDFELDLDFSPVTRLARQLGLQPENQQLSLVQPMMVMLLGASGCTLVLILLQFVAAYRVIRAISTPRWMTLVRRMQIILGIAAAILLAAIGICLEIVDYFSVIPFVLSGLFTLRLVWYGLCAWKTRH